MHLFIGKCKDDGMGIEENYTQDRYFVTCFFNLFLGFLISNKLGQLEFKLEKILGFRNKHTGKVRKGFVQTFRILK